MIWVHTYGIGKFKHTILRTVHDTEESAKFAQEVLGGEIVAYEKVEDLEELNDHIKEIVVNEVAYLIDSLSTEAPGSTLELEPGSTEWDCWKVKTLNNFAEILDGKFNEIV
ncbi:hypothetical protein VC1_62 [Vibrio phage Vc1]|uniref:Uncharacterized protein n=1 Tax=Vibrio phage Vc1 TaxID=1480731 RepID=A0A9X9SFC9_9CAUD|nr:hypothetical protein KMB90_gp62 [Vibrio virus 2019VC1]